MSDETINEFDYALPWWRRIVELSESQRKPMFMIREDSITRMMEASKTLHGKLVSSPLWELLRTEPVIVEFIAALADIESQLKKQEGIPGAGQI